MSPRTLLLDPALERYLEELLPEPPPLRALREATDRLAEREMRSSTLQLQLLAFLLRLQGAEQVLEIGCFTGYGTLALALALPPHGRVVTLDLEPRWMELGRPFWEQAGVADRILFREGPAEATLRELLREGGPEQFDLVYIDADKTSYPTYGRLGCELLRPGGLLAADNIFLGGRVADDREAARRPQVAAMRRFLTRLQRDPGLDVTVVPVGDGLLLARKRKTQIPAP